MLGLGVAALAVRFDISSLAGSALGGLMSMSTENNLVSPAQTQALNDALAARREEFRQLELVDPLGADELLAARAELGAHAGNLTVLAKARENRAGRPKNSRNKRNADLEQYLSQWGPHPLVAAERILATPIFEMMELSRRTVKKLSKSGEIIEVDEGMSFKECQDAHFRAMELLAPYREGKQSVRIDATIRHDGLLVIGGTTHSREETQTIIDAEFLAVDDQEPDWVEGVGA
jgi:hypothetical protein